MSMLGLLVNKKALAARGKKPGKKPKTDFVNTMPIAAFGPVLSLRGSLLPASPAPKKAKGKKAKPVAKKAPASPAPKKAKPAAKKAPASPAPKKAKPVAKKAPASSVAKKATRGGIFGTSAAAASRVAKKAPAATTVKKVARKKTGGNSPFAGLKSRTNALKNKRKTASVGRIASKYIGR